MGPPEAPPERLVVGLGNPGPAYEGTRHNAGFFVVERVARAVAAPAFEAGFEGRWTTGALAGRPVALLEPGTFMNRSGDAVAAALEGLGLGPDALVVVHDELDLPWGMVRLKVGGGLAGHRGLRSIAARLGTTDFVRLRVGIGRPPEGTDVSSWVLAPLAAPERDALPEVLDRAAGCLEALVRDGPEAAMRRFHGPAPAPGSADGAP